MYPALFLLPLQMLICYTLPNPNGFSGNPISLLPFSISLLTFYAWLTSEHLGPLLHFDLNLSKEIASLSRCREILLSPQLMAMSTVIWVFSQLGHGLWRAKPSSRGECRFRRLLFLPNWWWWGWHQLSGARFKMGRLSIQMAVFWISPVVSLPQ